MAKRTHGEQRRAQILDAAADLSTVTGLHALSFASVAAAVGLTKAGVSGHFDSKEALQLAVVERAAGDYKRALLEAGRSAEPGLPRLAALARGWFAHLADIPYRGGCFFAAAAQAFAGQPGAVRDAIAGYTQALIAELEEQARLAVRLDELADGVEPDRLVFQIHALTQEANLRRELLAVDDAFGQAMELLDDLLQRSAR